MRNPLLLVSALVLLLLAAPTPPALAQPINVVSVDCTPLVPFGFTSFGPSLTMGLAVQRCDPGGLFNVVELTPAAFQALTAAQLATFDVIAVNNHPGRLSCGAGGFGLGAGWHGVVGVQQCGGRVVLSSHDAPRFHSLVPPGATPMSLVCPGCEPFGACDLVRDSVAWAGSGPGTGLVIFNDAPFFVGGAGWNNAQLNLPAAWGIIDSGSQFPGPIGDGGYTRILPAFVGHPIYAAVNDLRLMPASISSFAANVGDASFHNIFAAFNPAILTPTEVVQNAGIVDPGNLGCCSFQPASGPDGTAITLIRDCDSDGDGIPDPADVCPGTTLPESVPTVTLGVNRWALVDGDGVFDTTAPPGGGNGPGRSYTLADTAGCSCEQIIAALGLGQGHSKRGCSISAMDEWVALVNP